MTVMSHHFQKLKKNQKLKKMTNLVIYIIIYIITDVFREVIYLIINQCGRRHPKDASGGHFVSASLAAQASEVSLYGTKLNFY